MFLTALDVIYGIEDAGAARCFLGARRSCFVCGWPMLIGVCSGYAATSWLAVFAFCNASNHNLFYLILRTPLVPSRILWTFSSIPGALFCLKKTTTRTKAKTCAKRYRIWGVL